MRLRRVHWKRGTSLVTQGDRAAMIGETRDGFLAGWRAFASPRPDHWVMWERIA